jgi:hypothetical protein
MSLSAYDVVRTINDITMLQAVLVPLWLQWQESGVEPSQAEIDAAVASVALGEELLVAAIERRRLRERAEVAVKS